jgi:hypothetical protein
MEQNLEVFFCDVCNSSVPAKDLETKAAVRVGERVIGRCCIASITPPPAAGPVPAAAASTTPPGAPAAGGSWAFSTVVVLIAVAGAAWFLDWRSGHEQATARQLVVDLGAQVQAQSQQIVELERRLQGLPARADLDALGTRIEQSGDKDRQAIDALRDSLVRIERELEGVRKAASGSNVVDQMVAQRLDSIDGSVRALLADLAALKAQPRAPAAPSEAGMDRPPESAPATPEEPGIPAEIAHLIARLADPEPENRFEAVDKLVQSRHKEARVPLLKMLKDSDPFVRRLTADGLQHFRHVESVDALLEALADPDSLIRHAAYTSLKGLTGQKLAFDADASRDERTTAQRRWQEWWRTARKSF